MVNSTLLSMSPDGRKGNELATFESRQTAASDEAIDIVL
jgi:hypothetical protein